MWWFLGALAWGVDLPSVDTPPRTGARAPADSAVVIGVQRYPFVSDVPYAHRDADAFRRLLLYTLGVPVDRIELLRDANKEQILEAIGRAGRQTGPGGRVWVYYSGHGAASPDTGERTLLGVDVQTDLETFRSRALPLQALEDAAIAGGGHAIFVLDTCYTGHDRAGAQLIEGARLAVPTWVHAPSPQIVEWSAAGPGEWSKPLPEAEHGAFTYAVLRALQGHADGQLDGRADGQITLEEAHLYVEEQLVELGITDQRPVFSGARGWVFSGSSTPPASRVPHPAPGPPQPSSPPGSNSDEPTPEIVLGPPRQEISRSHAVEVRALGAPELRRQCDAGDLLACTEQHCRSAPPGDATPTAHTGDEPLLPAREACGCVEGLLGGWDTQRCTSLGSVLGSEDPALARGWLEHACEGGDRRGCYELGLHIADREPRRATSLLTDVVVQERAVLRRHRSYTRRLGLDCDHGVTIACEALRRGGATGKQR